MDENTVNFRLERLPNDLDNNPFNLRREISLQIVGFWKDMWYDTLYETNVPH